MLSKEEILYFGDIGKGVKGLCTLSVKVKTDSDLEKEITYLDLPKDFQSEKCAIFDAENPNESEFIKNHSRYTPKDFIVIRGKNQDGSVAIISQYFSMDGIYERIITSMADPSKQAGYVGRHDNKKVLPNETRIGDTSQHMQYMHMLSRVARFLITGDGESFSRN